MPPKRPRKRPPPKPDFPAGDPPPPIDFTMKTESRKRRKTVNSTPIRLELSTPEQRQQNDENVSKRQSFPAAKQPYDPQSSGNGKRKRTMLEDDLDSKRLDVKKPSRMGSQSVMRGFSDIGTQIVRNHMQVMSGFSDMPSQSGTRTSARLSGRSDVADVGLDAGALSRARGSPGSRTHPSPGYSQSRGLTGRRRSVRIAAGQDKLDYEPNLTAVSGSEELSSKKRHESEVTLRSSRLATGAEKLVSPRKIPSPQRYEDSKAHHRETETLSTADLNIKVQNNTPRIPGTPKQVVPQHAADMLIRGLKVRMPVVEDFKEEHERLAFIFRNIKAFREHAISVKEAHNNNSYQELLDAALKAEESVREFMKIWNDFEECSYSREHRTSMSKSYKYLMYEPEALLKRLTEKCQQERVCVFFSKCFRVHDHNFSKFEVNLQDCQTKSY